MPPDVYQEVTDRIVGLIAEGQATGDNWLKPWASAASDGLPVNVSTHNTYRGINVLMLWATAVERSYPTNEWASYRQWKGKGAQVRGKPDDWPHHQDYGTRIVFAKEVLRKIKPGEKPNPKDVVMTERGPRVKVRMMQFTPVFNAEQVDGYEPDTGDRLSDLERIEECDRFVLHTGARVKWGERMACYSPDGDVILMPWGERFERPEDYYSVLFHELTHWTGNKERLDRDGLHEPLEKADPRYAGEELIAELGAAFQCARHGIEPQARVDHADYVAMYLKVLTDNKKAIVTAAAKAMDATNYLFELAGEPNGKE